MKIIEARDGFIKVEAAQKPAISSFLKVNGTDKSYIAQVIQVKNSGKNFIVYAKLLFVYDMDFFAYDKTLPNSSAEVVEFSFKQLAGILKHETPVIVGVTKDGCNITVDRNNLNKLLVSVDSAAINNVIVSNISKQLGVCSKVFIIDTLGTLEGNKKVAGTDFKLPVNKESLKFIFEDCLNDATSDSKALISDIFKDLAEYSQSVPFVPFSALKTIVDDMVDNSHIFKLLVLKNKLAKFEKLGYFASTAAEADNFDKILGDSSVIIDLSKLDSVFQNRYLGVLLSKINNAEGEKQLIIQASNMINKANLKNIVADKELPSIFIVQSKFKYINDIKTFFKGFIAENNFHNREAFKLYTPFIVAMGQDDYLVVGEGTNNIPLISKTEEIITPQEIIITKAVPEIIEEVLDSESDEKIDAIDKKSDELIQKTATEISETEQMSEINIFDDSEEVSEEVLQSGDTSVEDEPEEITIEPEVLADVDEVDELGTYGEISSEKIEVQPADNIEEIEPDEVIEESEQVDSVGNPELVITEDSSEEPIELSVQDDFDEYHTVVDSTKIVNIEETLPDQDDAEEQLVAESITEDDVELEGQSLTESITESNDEEERPILESINENSEEVKVDTKAIDFVEENTIEVSKEANTDNEELTMQQEPSDIENADPIEDTTSDEVFDEIVELDDDNIDADTIVVEMDDSFDSQISDSLLEENSAEKEIIEDVDKVYTTIKDDTISETDLDLIDELNDMDSASLTIEENDHDNEITDNEELEVLSDLPQDDSDEMFLEPIEELSIQEEPAENEILETRTTTTTTVPVYDAEIPQEDKVISDPIEQGDTVVHAKYGTGVVEKMIKYGTKELYSINFDNVGRRLLDPTLTEIKKA